MTTTISGKWISINDAIPEPYVLVLIAYADKDGFSTAALQKSGNWCVDVDSLVRRLYNEEESIVSHWSPYQEWLTHPDDK